jgi:regulator of vacuolar morphogenesis
MDSKELEERREGLERYLRAIVSAKDDKWRDTYAFQEFLGVPVGRQPLGAPRPNQGTGAISSAPQFSSSTWLDEHTELQSRLRDVWADIHKRDALSTQGDVAGAHKSNVAAKSKLAGVLSRIGVLGKGLQELAMTGLSEGELQRRTDMVARLQDDCEKLSRVVSVARQATQKMVESGGVTRPLAPTDTDREALLGLSGAKPARRVFGAPPKETEVTRPLDNVGLLSLQQQQIEQQDTQLSQLTTILQRQRQLGEAINAEVVSQIELLDDLSNEVDNVGVKLHAAKTQMNKLS